MRSLEQYLKDELARNKGNEFILHANDENDIYIHPWGRDGETVDFDLDGNKLKATADTKILGDRESEEHGLYHPDLFEDQV